MSDDKDEAGNGPAGAGRSPAVLTSAGASRTEANVFLRDQRQIIHFQMELRAKARLARVRELTPKPKPARLSHV